MAEPLSTKKRAALFRAFQEKQTVRHVSRKCGVSHTTVRKYRLREKWDERLKEIRKKAEAKADSKAATELAKNLQIVRWAKGRVLEEINKQKKGVKTKAPVAALEKLIRLELLLMGRPDSHTEITAEGESLRDKTTEELMAMLKEIRGALPANDNG